MVLLCIELMLFTSFVKLMFGTDRYASGLTLEQQCEAEVLCLDSGEADFVFPCFSWPAFDMDVRCFELDLFARFLLYMNPWIKSDTLYQDCFVYWRSHFLFKKAANSASAREDYPQCCLRCFFLKRLPWSILSHYSCLNIPWVNLNLWFNNSIAANASVHINMEPRNQDLEDDVPFQRVPDLLRN